MSGLTTTRRIAETWDRRLRQHEREILVTLAGLDEPLASRVWSSLTDSQEIRLLHAFRALADLGDVARYALGYSRTR